jgi:hypothetical protein
MTAREQLILARPGEVLFLLPPEEESDPPASPAEPEEPR